MGKTKEEHKGRRALRGAAWRVGLFALVAITLPSVGSSCYPHYKYQRYQPHSCRPKIIDWMDGTVPHLDPIDAACIEYERRTDRPAKDLLSDAHLMVRMHSGDPWICHKPQAPYETCTARLSEHVYLIEYRDDGKRGEYLWHEILHVIMHEDGLPGPLHHDIMVHRGWL